ncbi:MAG: peptide deformylase [Mycoplasmataceae bacterium]|nr:peptide deformylase [Mycoplasmataceae bacterium]
MIKKLIPSKTWLTYDTNPSIRQKCALVDINNLNQADFDLMNKMVAYIDATYEDKAEKYDIVPGLAIAANQLGINKQIVYLHFDEDGVEYKYMLMNPKILSSSLAKTYLKNGEGCLSVLDEHEGVSIRYKTVKVKAYDYLTKQEVIIDAKGLLAICLQHECDHLNGLLFYDRIAEIPLNAMPYKTKE